MPTRVKVEVCVTSVAEAMAARDAGADTVEVCAWLDSGGITPSFGLLNLLQERVAIRKRILVRPVPGGFHYDADDRQVLLRDVMMSGVGDKECGIVTGGLDAQGLPDHELWKAVRLATAGRELTFHRAIDVSADPLKSVEIMLLIGADRILTSGGARSAEEGIRTIADMVKRCDGRIALAAAAGVRPENVVAIVEGTGVPEVHFSAQRVLSDGSVAPDHARIEGVMNALVNAGLR